MQEIPPKRYKLFLRSRCAYAYDDRFRPGTAVQLLRLLAAQQTTESFGFEWCADDKHHWLRLNMRDEAGHLALIGNPIYLW